MLVMCTKPRCLMLMGMTLLEVMIAVMILVIAVFSLFSAALSFHQVQEDTDIQRKVASLEQTLRDRFLGALGANLGQWSDSQANDQTHNGLLWHRRQTPRSSSVTTAGYNTAKVLAGATEASATTLVSPRLPPLQEGSIYGKDHDLLYQLATVEQRALMDAGRPGLAPLGIPNVSVYVEYYKVDVVSLTMSTPNPVTAWKAQVTSPILDQYVLPESPGGGGSSPYTTDVSSSFMTLSGVLNAVCIRILISWHKDGEKNIVHSHEIVLVRRV